MRLTNLRHLLATQVFLLALFCAATLGHIIYVDDDAAGANNGTSWADAYRYLQDALADANSSEKPIEICVAQGIYKPDQGATQTPGNREATFQLINGVSLKGGYAGYGRSDPNMRDTNAYETILSGDLVGNDVEVFDPCDMVAEPTRLENSYHVVTGSGTEPNAVIDGFIITGGNAEPYFPYESMAYKPIGGGMYNVSGSPEVLNCTFKGNLAGDGGGMYNTNCSPRLINCIFYKNVARNITEQIADVVMSWYGQGGGVNNSGDTPILEGCEFYNNLASSGGGIYNQGSDPILKNCIFTNNRATTAGGGMRNWYKSDPRMTNCIFTNNLASRGGGIENYNCTLILTGCSFKGNSAESFGGAICNNSASPRLVKCTLTSNMAVYHGGAIYNYGESKSTLLNCVLVGNMTTWIGGGVNRGGGAMYNNDGISLILVNCTLTGNLGENANAFAFLSYRYPNHVQLINCILRNGGYEISNKDGSKIEITYSNIQGSQDSVYDPCEAVIWGMGNINTDPCFVDPGRWISANDPNKIAEPNDPNVVWIDGDYHLKSQAGRWDPNEQTWVKDDVTSPCIDAGDPNSPIGYEPFPNGGRINMGAYGGTVEASKSYFGEPICETIIAGDINGDCKVNFIDLQIMASHWLSDNNP